MGAAGIGNLVTWALTAPTLDVPARAAATGLPLVCCGRQLCEDTR